MRIAVTGSEGFIGTNLNNKLRQEYKFSVLKLDSKLGFDLCVEKTLSSIEPFEVLVHLAALSFVPDAFKNPSRFYYTNMVSTLNALELCRKHNAKMVFISSFVYGNPRYLPIDENHSISAFNPYAQSKIIGESLCEGYNRDFGLSCIILRPFNIYGPEQNDSFLLPSIVKQIKSGERIIKLKDPRPKRDFVHVEDVVNAIYLSIKKLTETSSSFEQYNVASGVSCSVLELTEIIKKVDSRYENLVFEFDSSQVRKNEVLETRGSYKKIFNDLNWEPKIPLEQGIKKWIKN